MTKTVVTSKGVSYLISVENLFSWDNNITLLINGVTVIDSMPVPSDSSANVCIIGNGESVTAIASDASGGYYNLRVFKVRRNRSVIWDGTGVTVRYSNATNRWVETSDMDVEAGAIIGQMLVSFSSGDAYMHDDYNNPGNLYGVQHPCGFVVVTSGNPGVMKEPEVVSIDSSTPPSYLHFRTESPNIQSTDLTESEFESIEGIHYANVMNDRLTPGADSYENARYSGDRIVGKDVIIAAEWDSPSIGEHVNYIDINYNISKGHR